MTHSVSRIVLVNPSVSSPQEGKPEGLAQGQGSPEISGTFQKFIIEKPHSPSGHAPVISPAQHQAARRRLFDHLVRQVLNEKGHPFSGLDKDLKQDMISSITEELVQSHYKI